MDEKPVLVTNLESTPFFEESHSVYNYRKHLVVPKTPDNQMTVAFMELPPGKANYPLHCHLAVTEVFYIICGEGVLETPDGERIVKTGDVCVFPPGRASAHRLRNDSAETLVYLDCDTVAAVDVALYPRSGKLGVITASIENDIFRESDAADYYDGED